MLNRSLSKLSQKQKYHLKYLRKKYRNELRSYTDRAEAREFIFEVQLREDRSRDCRLIRNHQRELKRLFKIHPELRGIVGSPAFSYGQKGVKTPYIIGENMRNYQLATIISKHIDPATRTEFNEAFKEVDQYFGISSQGLAYSIEKICLDLKPNSTVLFTSMLSDKLCLDMIMESLQCIANQQLALQDATNKILEKSFAEAVPDEHGFIRANQLTESSKAYLLGFQKGARTASIPLKVAYSIKKLGVYHQMLSVITRYCERVHQE